MSGYIPNILHAGGDYNTWYDDVGGNEHAARSPGRVVNKMLHHAGTAGANKILIHAADIAGPLWAIFGLVLFVIL